MPKTKGSAKGSKKGHMMPGMPDKMMSDKMMSGKMMSGKGKGAKGK